MKNGIGIVGLEGSLYYKDVESNNSYSSYIQGQSLILSNLWQEYFHPL